MNSFLEKGSYIRDRRSTT